MKERLLAVAVIAALAGPGSARGEPTGPQEILTMGTTDPNTGLPSTALTTAIAEWLVSVGFQPARQLPKIVAVSEEKLISMRQRGAPGEVVAVYDDSSSTIYLARGWIGATPAGLSVIVHEMVHHLQHEAGSKHACREERERDAFAAQERWLAEFGTNLETEFEIDPGCVKTPNMIPFDMVEGDS
jgi:hypothetical protein